MAKESYTLKLGFDQVLELILQLPDSEKKKLTEEIEKLSSLHTIKLTEEKIKSIFRIIRPYQTHTLGKYTHHKMSKDWAFYGLAFTRKDMGYLFGINIGFFKHSPDNMYTHVGMNLLVRTNGSNPELRQSYLDFFRTHLDFWINQSEKVFSYPVRGDKGIELARYFELNEIKNEDKLVDCFKDSMNSFQHVYQKIVENQELFEGVVRAAPKWDESIVEVCRTALEKKQSQ